MRGSMPVNKDHMEDLFDQNKLHNKGARMEQEQKARDDLVDKANPEGEQHGSTQEQPFPVPLDRLSEIDLSKLAKSQNLPSNLMDDKVNQPAGFQTTNQANQGDISVE